jgi:amino acid adenylation domain-containing protein
VIYGEERLTYRELNARANRLAHHLIRTGIRPGALVGISIERSLEMVIALLGILKSGGAYVPIALDLPALRREALVRDAGLKYMVTVDEQRMLYEGLVDFVLTATPAAAPEENPSTTLLAGMPAYVNYTSGSTGQPKGVLVPHAAVARLVITPNYVTLNASSRVLQYAPLSFDAATFEIWGALLNGGSLVIAPPRQLTAEDIGHFLEREQVNTAWLTSALFNEVVETSLHSLAGVRQLLAGGDILSVDHVERVRAAHPACQIINGYGPTENTTFTCCYPILAREPLDSGVAIGAPINGTRIAVLDRWLEPVPIGVPGELYASGAGLAHGYVNQRSVTAERFVPDPYATEPGGRMYRTGDLVRIRRDGVLMFVGRADQQVKIRGFRIEPGEVETVLKDCPKVAQAAILVRENERGDKTLVAYVAPETGADLDLTALRRRLSDRLPEYMVPSAFVVIDHLPLTPNGKLDRTALPAPEWRSRAYRAPRTPEEKSVCRIAAELLAVGQVGLDDNFFALGGHSLLASRFVARVRVQVGAKLLLRDVFTAPTFEDLSLTIRALLLANDGRRRAVAAASGDFEEEEL